MPETPRRSAFVHALGLGIDPAWRRLPPDQRCRDIMSLGQPLAGAATTTETYSMVGLQPGVDILLWSLGPSLEAIEERAAAVLRTGLGPWCHVSCSLLGLLQPSTYVRRPDIDAAALFDTLRARYLIVYPFTKTADWYLFSSDVRQGVMNEHMRIGHRYPEVRQLLANSFGIDDHDFVVAYGTDDLEAFSRLVRELRATESRRSTFADTPILTAVRRPLDQIGILLGASSTAASTPFESECTSSSARTLAGAQRRP